MIETISVNVAFLKITQKIKCKNDVSLFTVSLTFLILNVAFPKIMQKI